MHLWLWLLSGLIKTCSSKLSKLFRNHSLPPYRVEIDSPSPSHRVSASSGEQPLKHRLELVFLDDDAAKKRRRSLVYISVVGWMCLV